MVWCVMRAQSQVGTARFYRRAFDGDTQNSIEQYLLQLSVEANEAALRRHLGVGNSPASMRSGLVTSPTAMWGASSIGCVASS